ncbi:MAG TPA: glycosyltransferase family 4 protein [Solirubrobacteraceae bacterium]|nr:glycosyltransferase family 4 protein [Solirubrobacteraceae bacterium]
MILFLHHRYRAAGGEERAVEDLLWLVRERLGEDAELLVRDSALVGRSRAAAGMIAGGLAPDEVARAVRRTGARIVHAHNLHPTLGWRALAAARDAGARVVLHLHQYRLVCAIGVCFRDGQECTRCHGRNTLPGVALNCRGSRAEAAAYGAGLALWQRRLTGLADVCVVPSRFAGSRLRVLGAPLGPTFVLPHVIRGFAAAPAPGDGGHALVAARLAPEKGIETAIGACQIAGIPLVIAGDGPERERLQAVAAAATTTAPVTFAGRVSGDELARLRLGARLALVPSRSAETFGLAAAEAMAAGLPVAASRIGALAELVPGEWLVAPGDAPALAGAIRRLDSDGGAGARAIELARSVTAPEVVAPALAAVYERAVADRSGVSAASAPA